MDKNILGADAVGVKMILLGNEAIARGVIEAGASVVAAYPGTPSSEIVETLARLAKETKQYVEWSTNEKVAFECAVGASFLGVRSFSAMKSVGLNVAMDPLMVVNLCGVEGGFVFVVADDPNCWSTQNEQDSRMLAAAAEIPCLEPASAQEAKEMVSYAYDLSERLGRAVMIRTVTRLNHSRSIVELGPIYVKQQSPKYHRLRAGFPALPKHQRLHEEAAKLQDVMGECPFNELDMRTGARIGIVGIGNAVNFAVEAISHLGIEKEANLLKIGVINPLPVKLLKEFLRDQDVVVVFEEIEPYVENQIRSLCYDLMHKPRIVGKLSENIEIAGELTVEKAVRVLSQISKGKSDRASEESRSEENKLVLTRDTVLCAGCPHMGTFYATRRASSKTKGKVLISGDIGCYGIGVYPPYNLFDSHICMGSSIGVACGYAATGYKDGIICIIGDSTFYHSGMSALINAVFNNHNITVVILDNSIIGMTGHQPDPGTGVTATGQPTKRIELEEVVKSCGVDFVECVDAFHVKDVIKAVEMAMKHKGPSVVISRGECAIIRRKRKKDTKVNYKINIEKCDGCGVCVGLLYCPAILKEKSEYRIDKLICAGCGICSQICPKKAIEMEVVTN